MQQGLVTHYSDGHTNVGETALFAEMRQSDPTIYHAYPQDFDTYVAADWVVTATGSTTQALTAGDGGLLLITNSAGATDLCALQKTPAGWTFETGKKMFFRCRFKVSDATKSSLVFGIQVIDTTPLDVNDGAYFLKSAAATAVDFIVRKDTTTGSTKATHVTDMADDTYIELGWSYDGVNKVAYDVNRVVLGALDVTNSLPDTTCTVSFAVQNGEAVAKTMTVDFVEMFKERA